MCSFYGWAIFHCVYVPLLFIHLCVDEHLGFFHVLAIVNSAAMNNGIHVSFSILVSSVYILRSGIADHMVVLFLVFKEYPYHLPQWLYKFTFWPTVQECSLLCTPSPALIVCRLFNEGHSEWCEIVSNCSSFDLHLSNNGGGVGEASWDSLGLQGDPTSPF